jgi:hypothetical protein
MRWRNGGCFMPFMEAFCHWLNAFKKEPKVFKMRCRSHSHSHSHSHNGDEVVVVVVVGTTTTGDSLCLDTLQRILLGRLNCVSKQNILSI